MSRQALESQQAALCSAQRQLAQSDVRGRGGGGGGGDGGADDSGQTVTGWAGVSEEEEEGRDNQIVLLRQVGSEIDTLSNT